MNLDDLMAVWRSQDAAPLHGFNETLLRLALRQDEAKLQVQRRKERWSTYLASGVCVAFMAFFLAIMIYSYDSDSVTGWDFALPIVGMAAALISGRAIYVGHREQALREQSFGTSLRDQLNRRIAQLDDQATRARVTSVLVVSLLGTICPMILIVIGLRINQKSFSDEWAIMASMIFACVCSVATSAWELRRRVQRDVLPRKHRLEALLKELDGQ